MSDEKTNADLNAHIIRCHSLLTDLGIPRHSQKGESLSLYERLYSFKEKLIEQKIYNMIVSVSKEISIPTIFDLEDV